MRLIWTAVAFIDESKCTACGMCANVYPQGAIMINNLARVNAALYKGISDIPFRLDVVNVFTPLSITETIVKECQEKSIKRI